MSAGARIPLEHADALAHRLYAAWSLGAESIVVGSVRRRRDWVGDLELVMPCREPGEDVEFSRIEATMGQKAEGGLFGGVPALGRPLRGLKPGFLAASLLVSLDETREVGVQIFRYTPRNRGWLLLERTGPMDFGRWFLGQWKVARGIPTGDPKFRGSRDDHLLDRLGEIVDVFEEAECFKLAGVPYIAPHQRDAFMAQKAERAGAR